MDHEVGDLPRAKKVLANLRAIVGQASLIQVQDYGRGLGAVHIFIPPIMADVIESVALGEAWQYLGPADESPDDSVPTGLIEFSLWVRMDLS